jgi:internalin A
MSALALQRIREAKEQRLTRLDLGNCGLTELPDELFELTWLEELILCREIINYDTKSRKEFIIETKNKGDENQLFWGLPFGVSNFIHLKKI